MNQLQNMKIWIHWKRVEVNGRMTKKPVSAWGKATGSSANYSHTWTTYAQAKQLQSAKQADGIGFIIPDGYFFLDIDHRRMDDPMVRKMLRRFATYAEISPSGEGVHIYGKVDISRLPINTNEEGKRKLNDGYRMKNSKMGLELYISTVTNRYATFTGNVLQDMPVADCTDAVLQTLEEMKQPPTKANKSAAPQCTMEPVPKRKKPRHYNTAAEIISALRRQKNAEKFIELMDHGNRGRYKSHSEADLALCCLIAFRTDDPKLIDEVFRASKLYTAKWEREDYRTNTIRKAMESAEKRQQETETTTIPDWIAYDEKTERSKVLVPCLVEYMKASHIFLLIRTKGENLTRVYLYENGVYRKYSETDLKAMIKDIIASYDKNLVNVRTLNEAYNLFIIDTECCPDTMLDRDETIINFRNGILHVTPDKLQLLPHSPEHFSTVQYAFDWTEEAAPTPMFDAFLHTLTNGDQAVQNLLLQVIGVILSNVQGWRMKKALFLIGDGNTGKSVLKTLVERIVGTEYCFGCDLKQMEARFGAANLYGKRLCGSSDMSFDAIPELCVFKRATGGDTQQAEFKNQQGFSFVYRGFLWFCANQMPQFGGDTGQWVYERMLVVPCNNVIPPEKQDKHLIDKLYTERDGIVHKAIAALQKVIANGYRFDIPALVEEEKSDYHTQQNSAVDFWKECMVQCTKGDNVSEVYGAYRQWCVQHGIAAPEDKVAFRKKIAALYHIPHDALTTRRNSGMVYTNFALRK